MERALRQHVRYTERMIEVTVADEEIPRTGLGRGSPPDIEREAGRVDAEPGLFAGDRVPFDRHLPQLQARGGRQARGDAGARGRAARRQISWYMKRRSGSRRLLSPS